MAARCPICGDTFRSSAEVVQLESADIFHLACFLPIQEELAGEIAKTCKFREVHADWK